MTEEPWQSKSQVEYIYQVLSLFNVVGDDMFGQSWFVQFSCIAQGKFAE